MTNWIFYPPLAVDCGCVPKPCGDVSFFKVTRPSLSLYNELLDRIVSGKENVRATCHVLTHTEEMRCPATGQARREPAGQGRALSPRNRGCGLCGAGRPAHRGEASRAGLSPHLSLVGPHKGRACFPLQEASRPAPGRLRGRRRWLRLRICGVLALPRRGGLGRRPGPSAGLPELS